MTMLALPPPSSHAPRLRRWGARPIAAALPLALALLAAPGAAANPPPDMPPVPSGPAPAATAPPPGAPPIAPAPGQPPPRAPAPPGAVAPPGLSWMSPNELPPGYTAPPGYPPGYSPFAPPPSSYVDLSALPPPPPRQRYNAPMMAMGIVMVGGGLLSVITGSVLVSESTDRIDIYCDTPSSPCAHKDDASRRTGGALMMAIGAAAGAAGIPLWIIGAKMVPAPRDEKGSAPPKAAQAWPEVRVGAGGVSLVGRF